MTPTEAVTTSMWSEEAVQAVATAMHPDCDRSACPAHEVWVHQAREALKAAEPYTRPVDVSALLLDMPKKTVAARTVRPKETP